MKKVERPKLSGVQMDPKSEVNKSEACKVLGNLLLGKMLLWK